MQILCAFGETPRGFLNVAEMTAEVRSFNQRAGRGGGDNGSRNAGHSVGV